ncbi:chemotaxis protein CheB [Allorhodopirellula solitaria]|uniref:protein-glutamate methylesterase n=1 Tax=Allorhodopirellula solitaria TaxID=2527987 RepID=A0A5C5XUR8_9BACT|nr:chemotaxis protein CheB [Allorhodopirellula solitaria]TWT66478.1 Chemotaxis response regulator protein-glutamate methylesterase [Allorhodopirellula solitaria]
MSIKPEVVVMGASAGAIEAITEILSGLRERTGAPIVIVVHMPSAKDTHLATLLQNRCSRPIIEVEDKQPLERGHVYLAPPDYHVLVEDDTSLALSSEEPVNYSRPSIDVLFESAADVFSQLILGIILTGANQDGAKGLREILDVGGKALIQEPTEAHCRAMPDAAIATCPDARVMSLREISQYLNERI